MNEKTPIKLTHLLAAREGLVRRATLANMAFAYRLLSGFTERIHRAGLRGLVNIKSPEASGENWSSLTALEGSQARLEEHFSEEDVMDLTDAIRYVVGGEMVIDLSFRIEEIDDMFLVPLRDTLQDYGVVMDLPAVSSTEATSSSETEPPEPGSIQSNVR